MKIPPPYLGWFHCCWVFYKIQSLFLEWFDFKCTTSLSHFYNLVLTIYLKSFLVLKYDYNKLSKSTIRNSFNLQVAFSIYVVFISCLNMNVNCYRDIYVGFMTLMLFYTKISRKRLLESSLMLLHLIEFI